MCIGIGASTAFFGINDITESVWGDNLIKDVWGMSEDAYKWTELGLNIASTVCTIGGSALNKKLNSPKPKPPVQNPPAPHTDTPEPPVAHGSNNPNTAAAAKQGRAAHTNAKKNPADVYPNGDSVNFKTEHTIKSGKGGMRPDGIDFDNKIIYELKPNNPAAIAKGKNQLSNYIARMKEIGEGDFVGKIITYDIIDGKVVFNK